MDTKTKLTLMQRLVKENRELKEKNKELEHEINSRDMNKIIDESIVKLYANLHQNFNILIDSILGEYYINESYSDSKNNYRCTCRDIIDEFNNLRKKCRLPLIENKFEKENQHE